LIFSLAAAAAVRFFCIKRFPPGCDAEAMCN